MALADILYGGDRNMVIINMSEYKEDAQGLAPDRLRPGLRRLRRGRRPDRGGAPQALQRRPARRGRKGPRRRAGNLLPGLRQGHAAGRQGQRGQLQEHDHPADVERRHRHDHEAVRRPGHDAGPRRPGRGAAARPAQGVQAGAAGPHDGRPVLPARRRRCSRTSSACSSRRSATACAKTTGRRSPTTTPCSTTIAGRCKEVESGARNVDHILTGTLLPELSSQILTRTAEGIAIRSAHVGVDADGKFTYTIG